MEGSPSTHSGYAAALKSLCRRKDCQLIPNLNNELEIKMKKTMTASAIGVILLGSIAFASAAQSTAETGRWLTESGNLEVDIAPCGDALCGTVVKVIANRSMSRPGQAMEAADARSPLGMRLLTDFRPTGDGDWQGRIHNREDGQTYDCKLELLAPDQLKVRAYKGIPLFGKTQVWRRVEGGEK